MQIQGNYRHHLQPVNMQPFTTIRSHFRARVPKDSKPTGQVTFREYSRETAGAASGGW